MSQFFDVSPKTAKEAVNYRYMSHPELFDKRNIILGNQLFCLFKDKEAFIYDGRVRNH